MINFFRMTNPAAWLVRDAIPNYLKSVPIPYGYVSGTYYIMH